MQKINLLLAAKSKNFNFVEVKFNDYEQTKKTYTYKTLEDFKKGDLAVVKSPFGGYGGLKVVEIHNVNIYPDNDVYRYKWIVQRLDLSNYNHCMDVEKNMLTTINALEFNKCVEEFRNEAEKALGADVFNQLPTLNLINQTDNNSVISDEKLNENKEAFIDDDEAHKKINDFITNLIDLKLNFNNIYQRACSYNHNVLSGFFKRDDVHKLVSLKYNV